MRITKLNQIFGMLAEPTRPRPAAIVTLVRPVTDETRGLARSPAATPWRYDPISCRKKRADLKGSGSPTTSESNDAINQNQQLRRGGFDMFRGILTLTLSLCLGAAAAPAALAQRRHPSPNRRRTPSRWTPMFISTPSCRWTLRASNSPTSSRARKLQRPDEHVRQRARIPAGRFQGCRALQLRHAVFQSHGWT